MVAGRGALTFADVQAAARRIDGTATRTPVLTSRLVDVELGVHCYFKCENFQRTGAFKFRGAYNALSKLSPAERERGVVAYSSGNHAQAIALAARILGLPATIVMPFDTPPNKLEATESYGAAIRRYDRYTEDRDLIGRQLADEQGLTLIPPYDHADIIAGQGTAALELFEEVGELDALFTPLGGGGLLSGSVLAADGLSPDCQVFGVEPALGDDGRQSLRSGQIVHIPTPRTIADGAQTQHLGKLTFPIIQRGVKDILTATDRELVDGVRTFADTMKIVVEPTGCLGFAGLTNHRAQLAGRRVGIIISGGNVDPARLAEYLMAGTAGAGQPPGERHI